MRLGKLRMDVCPNGVLDACAAGEQRFQVSRLSAGQGRGWGGMSVVQAGEEVLWVCAY